MPVKSFDTFKGSIGLEAYLINTECYFFLSLDFLCRLQFSNCLRMLCQIKHMLCLRIDMRRKSAQCKTEELP